MFPVGIPRRIRHIAYLCGMKSEQLLRAILPDVLIGNFDVVNFEKTDSRFDIWLDEKKVMLKEYRRIGDVIAYGFGEYHAIRGFPHPRPCHLSSCAQA